MLWAKAKRGVALDRCLSIPWQAHMVLSYGTSTMRLSYCNLVLLAHEASVVVGSTLMPTIFKIIRIVKQK